MKILIPEQNISDSVLSVVSTLLLCKII